VTVDEDDRSRVGDLIGRFLGAFDAHDWADLESCLAPRLKVDYGDLRGSPPMEQPASQYVELRRAALDRLDVQHHHTDLIVSDTADPRHLRAQCRFQIYRFERSGPRHFHTYGTYEFGVERDSTGDLRISSIRQRVSGNSGDPAIHRGVTRN